MLELIEKPHKVYKEKKTVSNQPVMVVALKKLTEEIAAGNFKSGQAVKESVLAQKYRVSRSAIREALNQIVGWGLFEYIPYRGYQVKKFTIDDLLQWSELREAIEPIAARRIAKSQFPKALAVLEHYHKILLKAYDEEDLEEIYSADYHFHMSVVEQCKNTQFSQLQTISNHAAIFFFGRSMYETNLSLHKLANIDEQPGGDSQNVKEKFRGTISSHIEMLNAIRDGDAEKAEKTFKIHAAAQSLRIEKYHEIIHAMNK